MAIQWHNTKIMPTFMVVSMQISCMNFLLWILKLWLSRLQQMPHIVENIMHAQWLASTCLSMAVLKAIKPKILCFIMTLKMINGQLWTVWIYHAYHIIEWLQWDKKTTADWEIFLKAIKLCIFLAVRMKKANAQINFSR